MFSIDIDTSEFLNLARAMKNYRLAFINHLKRVTPSLMDYLRKIARQGVPYDTGTLERRVDYKQLAWDRYVAGVFEPNDYYSGAPASEFYDNSLHGHPNSKIYRRYKQYAQYNLDPNSWGTMPEDTLLRRVDEFLEREANSFTEKYFDKIK